MISELCPIEGASIPPAQTIKPLRYTYRGTTVRDLPLPGDEQSIIDYRTHLALEREARFTPEEFAVYLCERVRMAYRTPVCLKMECSWCGGLQPGDIRYFRDDSVWLDAW